MRTFLLMAVVAFAAIIIRGDSPAPGSVGNEEWIEARYGAWGGPGVPVKPGPMDTILLKDYAPKSSLVITETNVPKAKYPAGRPLAVPVLRPEIQAACHALRVRA